MLKRKISAALERFYSAQGSYALLIDGARQVGKTFIVEEFARSHYESMVKIDFVKMEGAVELFRSSWRGVPLAQGGGGGDSGI